MIVGTAGHIDHGKTSLVKALTGIDTDRLKEEKARGITIELGFAYLPRPDGDIIGFVDVPGHEKLVHTMLAGASGIDYVVLVVAADDGVMPQTREHLAILDLLGLDAGIVAMTKCDLADAARRDEVSGQIRATLAATALADAEILRVSATTGEGLAALIQCLDAARTARPKRHADGRFRLAIDRVFSLVGTGTVATGTVLSGRVAVGDQLIATPAGIAARVRSIHAQSRAAERGVAGERCAIALTGPDVSTASIRRGDVLADPALHAPVRRLDVRLTVLAAERKPIGQWMPVRLHHAAAETGAHVVPLIEGPLAPGSSEYAQLVLDAPLALAVGDRFVLRDAAASRTIGGGTILDLEPPERRRRTPERRAELDALAEPDPIHALERYLAGPRGWCDIGAFFRARAASEATQAQATEALGLVTLAAAPMTVAMLPATWERLAARIETLLTEFHAAHPDLPGLGQEQLRVALAPRLPAPVLAAVLHRLGGDRRIRLDRAWVRLPGHEVRFTAVEERTLQRITPALAGTNRFRPPRVRDIAKAQGLEESLVRRLMKMAARRGDLDEIAPDHYFAAATVIEMADLARALATAGDGSFTVVAFRDRLDNGRKVALQILEYFDKHGLTMRRDDVRRINPHKASLFSQPPGGAGTAVG